MWTMCLKKRIKYFQLIKGWNKNHLINADMPANANVHILK